MEKLYDKLSELVGDSNFETLVQDKVSGISFTVEDAHWHYEKEALANSEDELPFLELLGNRYEEESWVSTEDLANGDIKPIGNGYIFSSRGIEIVFTTKENKCK